ncbi:uncharacterized protein LOC128618704 isoform X1 [Ictalurus furcatus]|uniref:uncharacterized protein LOC128618704 isoform X1 n=2 Tax=Ictalurus furcatus TaxID=66913 RepID=UPI0023507AC1|nr:uncharacterized protein LOC128618704 isoform X1 [Ictalurus furcatus]
MPPLKCDLLFSNDPGRKMVATGLTCFLIASLIYYVMSACHSPTAGNITAQVTNLSPATSCFTNVNVTCETNLSLNLIYGFEWQKDQNNIDSNKQNILVQKIKKNVTLTCTVLSSCGNVTSSSYNITSCPEDNITTVLLICGAGAIIVIFMFAITMKIMLKRGEAQRQARRQQRQVMQSNDSTATVTSYW